MFRSGNPALKEHTFDVPPLPGVAASMTLDGVVQKSALLLIAAFASATALWWRYMDAVRQGNEAAMGQLFVWTIGSVIAGLVLALVTVFKKEWAGVTSLPYALVQGVVLGSVSLLVEIRFPNIVLQAVALTFGVFAALLLAYSSGWIKPSQNFRLGVAAATGGIFLLYMVDLGMGFFGRSIPMIHEGGPIGIGFSVLVVGVAAMNLVLDFDFIENGVASGAPKYLEWYAAFGLIVTLFWLYLEMLRLLRKLRG